MFWLGLLLVVLLVLNALAHLGVATEGPPPDRPFGALTLILAGLGLVGHTLCASEGFLFAPEIGVILYQGSGLWRAGLYLLLLGIAFSAALIPETVRQFVHRDEPVRWAHLNRLLSIATGVTVVSGLRIRLLNPEDFSSLQIQAYDLFFPPLALWTGACLLLALAWCLRVPKGWRMAVPVLWTAVFWLSVELRARPFDDFWTIWAWRALGAVILLVFVLTRGFRQTAWAFRKEEVSALEVRKRRAAAVALAILLVSLSGLYLLMSFGFLHIDLQLLVIGYLFFWLVLAEVKDMRGVLTGWHAKEAEEYLLGKALRLAGKALRFVGRSLKFENSGAAVVKTLALCLVVLAINEIGNRRKTIVEPFRVLAEPSVEKKSGLGEDVAGYLFNQLGLFEKELRQTVIPLTGSVQASAPGTDRVSSGFAASSGFYEGLSFVSSTEVVIANVRIPVHVLLSPILRPIRSLLGTRVLTGAVQLDEDSYKLIVSSTRGESWQLERTRLGGEDGNAEADVMYWTFLEMADELAFNVFADSEASALGETRSREVFETVRQHLEVLSEEKCSRSDAWFQASSSLQQIVADDPSFALARYHLALALLECSLFNEPVLILRETVKEAPRYIPAYNALAYALVRWNEDELEAERLWKRVLSSSEAGTISRALAYHGLARLMLDPDDLLAVKAGFEEASDTGTKGLAERGLKYLDRSTLAFYYARRAERLYVETGGADPQIVHRRATALGDLARILERRAGGFLSVNPEVWSCQGEVLLFGFDSQALAPDATENGDAAWVLETIDGPFRVDPRELSSKLERRGLQGLYLAADPTPVGQLDTWRVETQAHESYLLILEGRRLNVYGKALRRSHYNKVARRFLRQAIALQPVDSTNLCHLAASNYVLGNDRQMKNLQDEIRARWALAQRYAVHYPIRDNTVRLPAYFFEQAIAEYATIAENTKIWKTSSLEEVEAARCTVYNEAIQRSPLSVEAPCRPSTRPFPASLAVAEDATPATALDDVDEDLFLPDFGDEDAIFIPEDF